LQHAPSDYDCPFCALIRGEERPPWTLRSDLVWEDEETTAWMNPRWWENNPGNVLVIPNRHVENIFELDGRLAAAVHDTARRIASAMTEAYPCGGVTTRQNNGPRAGQEVWHYHVHVFPRHRGDGLYGASARLTTPEERRPYAERLRAALERPHG
jgi:histidine triad (HIT) family protein